MCGQPRCYATHSWFSSSVYNKIDIFFCEFFRVFISSWGITIGIPTTLYFSVYSIQRNVDIFEIEWSTIINITIKNVFNYLENSIERVIDFENRLLLLLLGRRVIFCIEKRAVSIRVSNAQSDIKLRVIVVVFGKNSIFLLPMKTYGLCVCVCNSLVFSETCSRENLTYITQTHVVPNIFKKNRRRYRVVIHWFRNAQDK